MNPPGTIPLPRLKKQMPVEHAEPPITAIVPVCLSSERLYDVASIAWLKQAALRPGNFYASEGINLAFEGILVKLNSTDVLPRQPENAREIL